MVKSVLSVSHRGLRDWVIQRVSAIVMAVCFFALLFYILCHPDVSFSEWKGLFSQNPVKIMAILCLLSMLFHAWIGIWTIITDYIKQYVIRFTLHIFVFFMLTALFIWGLLILWSV